MQHTSNKAPKNINVKSNTWQGTCKLLNASASQYGSGGSQCYFTIMTRVKPFVITKCELKLHREENHYAEKPLALAF